MHVVRLGIHRRQLASFFPQRTKVRDNRYVGAASRTLTLGDPIFRSLPSLPVERSPLSFFSPILLPSHSSFCNSCVRSPARSYPPPLPLAASLRLTSPAPSQVFLFISGVARVPRLRNPRSLLPAMRARCAMQPPRGMPPMQPSKGAISLQHRNPWKSFVTFDTIPFTFHENLNHFPNRRRRLPRHFSLQFHTFLSMMLRYINRYGL